MNVNMSSTMLPVPVPQCQQRSPSNSSLESSTPPSPDHMRMGSSSGTPPPRTHNGRQRLRPFLISCIESGRVKGLEWMNKEKTLFKIPWKHAGKQDYNPEEDSKIFKLWSSNTGKYKEGIHVPEPAVWKTRLRTALNKLPDIEEIQDKTQLDIPEPYRVYKLHPKKLTGRKRPPSEYQPQCHQVSGMSHSVPSYISKSPNGYDISSGQYQSRHYYPGQQSIPEYDYNGYPLATTYRRDATTDLSLQDVDSVIRQNSPPHFTHDLTSCSPSSMYHHQSMPDGGGVVDETATKIARAMMTNNNDPMQLNFHDLVPAAGHQESMNYQATTKSYPDYNQAPLYNSTCTPTTMATDTMTNCGPRIDNPVPMDMSCQQSQASRHSSVDELPSEQTMMIQVYYRSLNAGSYQVDNPSGCMLYSKQPWEDGRSHGMESIPLPDISDLISPETPGINPKTIELTSEVLRCFEKGMSIQCKNGGDIYVTRRCRSVVFWGLAEGSSEGGHTHDKLEREEEVKVFDLQEFRERMRQYLRGEKHSPPLPEIYFTVAQKWAGAPDASLHSCLVSMVLTPVRAAVELRSVNHDVKTPPHSAHSGMLHFSGPDVPTPPNHWAAEWNTHSHHYNASHSPTPPTVFAAYT